MIPKLATNLLHLNVQRAAAAVQNGASTTLRNLQLQSANGGSLNWAGAGSSSSGWGNTGGAKYNASSKLYQGYTGPGRAITHANAEHHDDSDDPRALALSPRRPRALPGHGRRGRAASLAPSPADLRLLKTIFAARAASVRHNSTSTVAAELPPELDLAATPSSPIADVPSRTGLGRRSKSMSMLPNLPAHKADLAEDTVEKNMRDWESWNILATAEDPAVVRREIHRIRTEVYPFDKHNHARGRSKSNQAPRTPQPSTAWFNAALGALYRIRLNGQPVTDVIRLYNDMIARGVLPNANTYAIVINTLSERDWEVVRTLHALDHERIRSTINTQPATSTCPPSMTINELLTSPDLVRALPHHAETIRMLRAEIHLPAALALFHAAAVFRGFARSLPVATFSRLLRACAARGERGGAVRVWEVLEQRQASNALQRTNYIPPVFRHLIATYSAARDIGGAEEVFKEWISFVTAGRVFGVGPASIPPEDAKLNRDLAPPVDSESEDADLPPGSGGERDVWDEMIVAYIMCGNSDKAVELVESMIDGRNDAPRPTGVTFSRMIRAFCDAGDAGTAYTWFQRLRSMGGAYTPNVYAWAHIITGLGTSGRVRELNELFASLLDTSKLGMFRLRHAQARVLVEANTAAIERGAARIRASADPSDQTVLIAKEAAQFLISTVIPHLPSLSQAYQIGVLRDLSIELVGPKTIGIVSDEGAVQIVQDRAANEIEALKYAANSVLKRPEYSPEQVAEQNMSMISRATANAVDELIRSLYTARQLTLNQHIRVAQVWCSVTSQLPHELPARGIVDTLVGFEEQLSAEDWALVSNAFAVVLVNQGTITDAALAAFSRAPLGLVNWRDVVRGAIPSLGYERTREALGGMGQEVLELIDTFAPKADSPIESIPSTPLSPETSYTSAAEESLPNGRPRSPKLHIDALQSKFVDEYILPRSSVTPLDAYARFAAGLQIGRLPVPETIGRLINALGRLGELDKVQHLYSIGQEALACFEHDKPRQAQAWFQLEDQMLTALAHADRPEAAAVHKARIIGQGGAPSADAYGALIAGVKNTTDDAQVARDLFEEARRLGVPANIFLYNTVISKAARARKAEYALELFHEMRSAGLRPTSVTYGAIIGACCRVGDADTASYLFAEMSSMPNFKPRVPPYNTMMQYFVSTKPDRERCLDYFQAMLDAKVAPSAHTYKLLLDCYGSIEPIDLASMEDVFKRLQQDRLVAVQGAHWASLINAYGCTARDLDRALQTFERIPAHTTPDAVAFEALFNAIITHHRVDLVPTYLERMASAGVHMTAYIANLLIKGYAAAGQLERARKVFDSMVDPPVGLAAVHNHPNHPHGPEAETAVPVTAPVYREPSTWEAIVRAELGAGEKKRAARLLDRMEERMFPVAVTSRIRSIMGEDGSLVEPRPASESKN